MDVTIKGFGKAKCTEWLSKHLAVLKKAFKISDKAKWYLERDDEDEDATILSVQAREPVEGMTYERQVFRIYWQIQYTPACCGMAFIHHFAAPYHIASEEAKQSMAWIVDTMLQAGYWQDESDNVLGNPDWLGNSDQEAYLLNLVRNDDGENYEPFWHWWANKWHSPEGHVEFLNFNSDNYILTTITRSKH